ncbi:CRISPR-associated helicase/endonuclease Cas3 [Paenibacillus sp. 598K]|uniref:CRISPR-associated helicase Cas3' n=1 Tax=Paenibacillus sp. 598K TaxID=1117987 RepID=UPI000FF92CF3|nr:CRISPR-associated helicase Cas3' [Paenibacillus sp. 598K]GBF74459.1 CRISPR-associated helicase/endonuclease Cas3 [Paenibacillus sp. 598K]
MPYIAHIRESDHTIQTASEHLLEAMTLAERYGSKLQIPHVTGLAGLLHDLGKLTPQFRDYLWNAVFHPDKAPRRGEVDHSTAGGKLLFDRLHQGKPAPSWLLAEVVGNAIISHHSYMHDYLNEHLESDYLRRVRDKSAEKLDYDTAVGAFFEEVMSEAAFTAYIEQAIVELTQYMRKPSVLTSEQKLLFLDKYIFSALIDADRTNTRRFEQAEPPLPGMVQEREQRRALYKGYYERLMERLASYAKDAQAQKQSTQAQKSIDRLRQEMSEQCDSFASRPSGIYTLSIPTGGGKTLASFRYALRHAIEHGKQRILYVVPYTTIIEQNAEEIRRIIKDDGQLLEHHSNVVLDERDEDEQSDGQMTTAEKLKLARDNWDVPIIFTTMVQFLNAIYARGTRNIRRFHNLSEAVIIFDEVQKVPTSCISLFNTALNFLKGYGASSLVLCTATQPALDFVRHRLTIDPEGEIVGNLQDVDIAFKRVEMVDRATMETFDTENLADFIQEQMAEVTSVLVILNTKSVVKKLYERLAGCDAAVYHLSTSMCAQHRKDKLDEIRGLLDREERVICVSTQLIEAGVDVSFHRVIRSLSGLDSIAQAAGRCNRHGEKGIQPVYVIDHTEERLTRLREIQIGKEKTRQILIDLQRDPSAHGGHMLSREALGVYFQRFYKELEREVDYYMPKLERSMMTLLMETQTHSMSFLRQYIAHHDKPPDLIMTNSPRTAAEHFEVIDSPTIAAIAPYGEGSELIAELINGRSIAELGSALRKAQQYSVNLFCHEREALAKSQGIETILDGKVYVLKEGAYSKEYGLSVTNE